MKDFAKTFASKIFGQIVVTNDVCGNSVPALHCRVAPPGLGVCAAFISFSLTDEGETAAATAFEKMDLAKAEKLARYVWAAVGIPLHTALLVLGEETPPPYVDKTESDIRDAVHGYYLALDKRQHGGAAQDIAFRKIEQALGMRWVEGSALSAQKVGA